MPLQEILWNVSGRRLLGRTGNWLTLKDSSSSGLLNVSNIITISNHAIVCNAIYVQGKLCIAKMDQHESNQCKNHASLSSTFDPWPLLHVQELLIIVYMDNSSTPI